VKKYLFISFFLLSFCGTIHQAIGQCAAPLIPVNIIINPDTYPQEITWSLTNSGVTIASGTSAGASVCVTPESCLSFQINDSAGDGICCGYGTGSFYITLNGDTIATGGNYGSGQTVQFNCPPGGDCISAIPAIEGSQIAPQRNTWYTFSPDSSGMYFVSTCAGNTPLLTARFLGWKAFTSPLESLTLYRPVALL